MLNINYWSNFYLMDLKLKATRNVIKKGTGSLIQTPPARWPWEDCEASSRLALRLQVKELLSALPSACPRAQPLAGWLPFLNTIRPCTEGRARWHNLRLHHVVQAEEEWPCNRMCHEARVAPWVSLLAVPVLLPWACQAQRGQPPGSCHYQQPRPVRQAATPGTAPAPSSGLLQGKS